MPTATQSSVSSDLSALAAAIATAAQIAARLAESGIPALIAESNAAFGTLAGCEIAAPGAPGGCVIADQHFLTRLHSIRLVDPITGATLWPR